MQIPSSLRLHSKSKERLKYHYKTVLLRIIPQYKLCNQKHKHKHSNACKVEDQRSHSNKEVNKQWRFEQEHPPLLW